jgi:hypothetical protein
MNKIVPFELAQLLNEKGFSETTLPYYVKDTLWNDRIGKLGSYDECSSNPSSLVNYGGTSYKDVIPAPTIAEVLDWIFSNFNTWIFVDAQFKKDSISFWWNIKAYKHNKWSKLTKRFESESDAYEDAIRQFIRDADWNNKTLSNK